MKKNGGRKRFGLEDYEELHISRFGVCGRAVVEWGERERIRCVAGG